MTPNQITALRVVMAAVAIVLFGHSPVANRTALALTISAVFLDAVDGWVARRRNLATPLGAQLDILGDRVIENLFFTFFAVAGLISLWVPLFFFVRGTATDFLRQRAARRGRNGFGKHSMYTSAWARALVASRASRAAYGILKCVCFVWLGLVLSLRHGVPAASWAVWINSLAPAIVGLTVAFCFVRGIPVLWEGRRYLQPAPVRNASRNAVRKPALTPSISGTTKAAA